MNTFYRLGSNQVNEFYDKVKSYEKKIHSGMCIDDIVDVLEEQYIYRLIEKADTDDEHFQEFISTESDRLDMEYDALFAACKDLNISVDTNPSLSKRKGKVK